MLDVSAAQAELARRSFLHYCRLIDPKYDTNAKHIRFLADLLERIERRELEQEKLILTVAPRTGKSRLLSRYASWLLGRNEDKSLLLLSASQTLSVRNSRWIRDDVLSERYPWKVTISEDSSSILNWRTSTGNEVRAFSSGSVLTGHSGSLAILADDIQPDAMSPLTRDALELWLRSVLESRRDPHCPLIILQNRWSTDDIVARLVDGPDGDSFQVINLEAICETRESDPLNRQLGESVWPERWPVELLEKKKRAVGNHVWESSYQGHPTPEGGRLIAVGLFKHYDLLPSAPQMEWNPLDHWYESPLERAKAVDDSFLRVTGIDTSGVATTTTSGSWNAWCTCMLDTRTGNIFVISVDRARNISFEELRSRVLGHLGTFTPDLCVVEDASQGGRLAESIRGASRTPVQLVEPRQSKEDRVIGILPLLEGGKIHIPTRAQWRGTFLKELSDFPASRTSDIVDAWCYAVTYCKFALARRRSDELFNRQMEQFSLFG